MITVFLVTSQPGQLSLAIPLWVSAVSTEYGFGYGGNGKFHVTGGAVIGIDDILALSLYIIKLLMLVNFFTTPKY